MKKAGKAGPRDRAPGPATALDYFLSPGSFLSLPSFSSAVVTFTFGTVSVSFSVYTPTFGTSTSFFSDETLTLGAVTSYFGSVTSPSLVFDTSNFGASTLPSWVLRTSQPTRAMEAADTR